MSESQLDVIGRPVNEGDAVVFSHHHTLYVGKVTKLLPKQLRVVPIGTQYRSEEGFLKYSEQCALIGGPDLTMWILKKG
jgi:hypothetical protein